MERAPHDPDVRQIINEHFERFDRLLSVYFASLQEAGILTKRFEPKVYAQSLISTLFSIGVLSCLNLDLQARANVVKATMAFYE